MNTTATLDSKKPTTKQELIAANIKLLIEQLEAGKSEALTHYLTAMSRFHNYSFGNVLEIARQMPAGFWAWKNLGRSVNAGAKGIRILAPIVGVRRKKDEEAEKDITKQNERALLGFRNAYPMESILEDISPDVAKIKVPTILLAGELDQVDSIERHKTEVLAYLPNADFKIIKGSGHLIPIDEPVQLAREIANYVSQLAK